jgi:hypothetical protein
MNDISNIIENQFKVLPQVIQDTILNSNWQEKIRRIVKVNNLHVDQGAAIENLVLITMLGIETPEHFVENAKEYAQVTEEQAYNISAEVEREIFGDIRKKLIEITDVSGTVAEIDKATNELDKVAAAIEKEVSTTKTSLKEKIPTNYFKENKTEVKKEIVPDPYKEPLIVESEIKPVAPIIKKEPKPIFNPIPKNISEASIDKTPVKLDPYREAIE